MTTLLAKLKADALAARKARDTLCATSLTTLIGELETAAKNAGHEPSDTEVITAIKKTLKNIGETLDALKFSSDDRAHALLTEQKLFETYLPKQLNETELLEIVKAMIMTGAGNVGEIMKRLKIQYEGQYDGKLASTVIKVALS